MSNPTIIKHQDDTFHSWIWEQMWFGVGTPVTKYNFHKPNVGDKVTRWDDAVYRVTAVTEDGIPTLELQSRLRNESIFNENSTSLITALSIYQPNSPTRLFVDRNVSPASVNVDARMLVFEEESDKLRFFLGSDTSENGTVISERYNSSGVLISDEVELIETTPGDPKEKRPTAFNTTSDIKTGDVVTAVAYTPTGRVTGSWPFLVVEATNALAPSAAGVYLQDISLESALLSDTDLTLIENQVNSPFTTMLVQCRLHYSDGSSSLVNVDGNKCILHGVENFDTSLTIRPVDVMLSYYPDDTEPFINGSGGARPHITRPYRLANIVHDSSINLKLYVIPTFVDAVTGYTYVWKLVNLDGDVNIDVTDDVTANTLSGVSISGTDYGNKQSVRLAIRMDDIGLGGIYSGHIHTQDVGVTVSIPGTPGAYPWVLDYVGDGGNPFGLQWYASASNVGSGAINVGQGANDIDEWLSYLYTPLAPLFDVTLQLEPTRPTHFAIEYNGVREVYPVENYDANLTKVATAPAFADNQTVSIEWIHRTGTTDRILGISPLLIKVDL